VKIFPANDRVAYEREHAKDPGPKLQEFITDPAIFSSHEKRQDYAGKQDQHKHGEDQKNPKCKQFEKKGFDDFQKLPLKILHKF
jgi:hypothetical protein